MDTPESFIVIFFSPEKLALLLLLKKYDETSNIWWGLIALFPQN